MIDLSLLIYVVLILYFEMAAVNNVCDMRSQNTGSSFPPPCLAPSYSNSKTDISVKIHQEMAEL